MAAGDIFYAKPNPSITLPIQVLDLLVPLG